MQILDLEPTPTASRRAVLDPARSAVIPGPGLGVEHDGARSASAGS